MNYNTDGFNERTNFIHNSNDLNKAKKNHIQLNTSFTEMKIKENSSNVKTHSNDLSICDNTRKYNSLNQFNLFNNYKSNSAKK